MIYLDITDGIERKNVKNIIAEFNEKNLLSEENLFETEDEINKKIQNSKIIICDDNSEKINKYLKLNKKVIVFIKKRKNTKIIDELYLQKGVFTYSRKNELREIISFQLKINKKLKLIKMTSTLLTTIILLFCFSDVFSINKPVKETLADNLISEAPKVEVTPSKKELLKYENIVFFGDSITQFYNLNKYYNQIPVVNSGTSGYTTSDLLATIKEKVYVYNPTKVVLLIGINDMNKKVDDLNILENIKTIASNIKENRPKTKIYIESIYPVDKDRYHILVETNVDNNKIREVNKIIKEICDENGYVYINMFDELNNKEQDKLIYEYSTDGLHLSDAGYEVVTKKIMSVLEEE